jgi:hypothetical protein
LSMTVIGLFTDLLLHTARNVVLTLCGLLFKPVLLSQTREWERVELLPLRLIHSLM